MHTDKTVRFAIIGCGTVAPLHAESISAATGAELVAVADVDLDRARALGARFGDPRVYRDVDQLLAAEDVEVVTIATPSGLHAELAVAAAQAGKHVLCEKPLDVSADNMSKMIEAADRAGTKLGVIYQRRAYPVGLAVRAALAEGTFGRLVLADAYLKYYRSQAYYASAGWRGTWAMDGGGALMNQGVHGVDMIQWLGGGIRSVFARAGHLARNIEVEDTAVAVAEYSHGGFGVIEATTLAYPERSTRFEIHGESGTVIFDDQGLKEWHQLEGAPAPQSLAVPEIEGVHSYGHYRFIEDMAAAVRDNREPLVSGREARKAVDVILAIYRSAEIGLPVSVEAPS